MKLKVIVLVLLLLGTVFSQWALNREGCTTAIIHSDAAGEGVPILWKNRDTGFLSNKVIYVNEMPFSYIGLVNAKETSGRWVYAGLNCEGFGIMNSVAYNLPKKTGEVDIPIKIGRVGPENSIKEVKRGEIAYWPQSQLIMMFLKDQKTFNPVNVVGEIENLSFFDSLERGATAKLQMVESPIDDKYYL